MPRLSTQWLAVGMAAMAGATAYPLAASAGGHQGKGPEVLGCADLAAAILDNQGNDLFEDVFPGKGQDAFPGKGRDAGPRSRVLRRRRCSCQQGPSLLRSQADLLAHHIQLIAR